MKRNYNTIAKNIIKIALTVALSCGMLVQAVPTAADTRLCDENNTWVYQVSGSMVVPQTQKSHNGDIVHHLRFSKDGSNPGSDYMIFRATRTLMLDTEGNSFDITISSSDNPTQWLFREDGSKVWVYDNDRQCDVLMYDFSAKTGDVLPGRQGSTVFSEVQDWKYAVLERPDTLLGNTMRHRYTATETYDSNTTVSNPELECIEGIGVTCGFLPEMNVMKTTHGPFEDVAFDRPGMLGYLVAVYDNNGDFIYGDKESYNALLNRISGVSDIMANDDASEPVYYNLQGQRISEPEKGQPCIERRGNKARKIVMP